MKLKIRASIAGITLFLLPAFVFAQTPQDFKGLVAKFLEIISLLVPVIFGLTLIVLLWGIMQAWILGGGDPIKVEEGKQIALWGVIALVVMSGLWAIVVIIKNSLL